MQWYYMMFMKLLLMLLIPKHGFLKGGGAESAKGNLDWRRGGLCWSSISAVLGQRFGFWYRSRLMSWNHVVLFPAYVYLKLGCPIVTDPHGASRFICNKPWKMKATEWWESWCCPKLQLFQMIRWSYEANYFKHWKIGQMTIATKIWSLTRGHVFGPTAFDRFAAQGICTELEKSNSMQHKAKLLKDQAQRLQASLKVWWWDAHLRLLMIDHVK